MNINLNRVRAAVVGCVLAFGLSACGDSDSGTDSSKYDDESMSSMSADGNSDSNVESSSSVDMGSNSETAEESSSSSKIAEEADSSSDTVEESSSSEDACKVYEPIAGEPVSDEPAAPVYKIEETCKEVGACNAMDVDDVSTWHFVREDNFGDDAEYTYSVSGSKLTLTIVYADGTKDVDSDSYSFYNMDKESGKTMAFSAVKSTCIDGKGNIHRVEVCTKDSVLVDRVMLLPEWPLDDVEAGSKYDADKNTLTDLRDNQVYKTTKIGKQVWMAENLNYAYLQNSITYNARGDISEYSYDSTSFCHNNVVANCKKFGRFYTWSAAMDSAEVFEKNSAGCGTYETAGPGSSRPNTCKPQGNVRGVCPKGWHLPSKDEYKELLAEVDSIVDPEFLNRSYAGYRLKSVCSWSEKNGNDAVGFNALPASSGKIGDIASFWSSTQYDDNSGGLDPSSAAYALGMQYNYDDADIHGLFKSGSSSVRCVMD